MANTDTASPAPSTGTSLNGKELATEHVAQAALMSETVKEPPSTTTTPASPPSVSASNSATSASQPPSTAPVRPSLVPPSNGQYSLSTASHPKKFSAVNVNKKFLEKTAQASATASPAASAAKSSATVARPAVTHTQSHSRLVTAKLTASPVPSTAGWSRPASVAPTGNSSPNSTSPLPTSTGPSNIASSAPQLPHVGKVIQPQPKTATALAGSSGKELFSGAKLVWGNVKPSAVPVRLDIPAEDFPTAAEAVKGAISSAKKPKAESEDNKSTEAAKQAKEEADAFRGLHLDPNAHHWDEMEEDDDDFLGGVVEFDDGRQYKVESVDGGDKPPSPGGNVRDRDIDDFDRSWPRSKSSPLDTSRDLTSPTDVRSPTSSLNGLHLGTSPVESSRHLFNERSNRLEPYSLSRAGPPLVSGRPHRDFSGPPPNILHKQATDFPPRNRRFSGASAGSAAGPSISPRDSHFPRRDGPPSSPRIPRDGGHLMAPSTSFSGRERPDAGRRSNMGPPPVPPRALRTAQETGRQLPPHLTQNNAFRREPRSMNHEPPTPASSKAPSLPSHSPIATHAQLSTVSPLIGSVAGLPLPPGADLEEVRKDVMHSAATRAKQRREQEEAEREAQKERARRKAHELEEKMKATALEKERQEQQKEAAEAETKGSELPPSLSSKEAAAVDRIIEDAVQSAKDAMPATKPAPSSFAETSRRPFAGSQRSALAKEDSWRSTAPPPAPPLQQRKASSGFVASAHTALDAAVDTKEEDLEIVDFSDMGKLLGASQQKPNEAPETPSADARTTRPVASDFFDEQTLVPETAKEAPMSWRRKAPIAQPEQLPVAAEDDGAVPDQEHPASTPVNDDSNQALEQTTPPSASSSRESLTSASEINGRNSAGGVPRTPRSQAFFKEATMSSLDDTMSRIKGAITHMKTCDVPDRSSEQYREPAHPRYLQQQGYFKPPRERWVPPALRQRHFGFLEDEEREVFDVTIVALPPSPPSSAFLVQLPKQSRTVEFIHRKQLQAFHRPQGPARFELLSFDPPVEGMSRREFSVNDILFRKPGFFKGKPPKYRVLLPRRQQKSTLRGFGKTPVADMMVSWRKPAVLAAEKLSKQSTAGATEVAGLSTMSRSPPPDVLPSGTSTSLPKPTELAAAKVDPHPGARTRPQPKMPAGSAVAVRRDSRIDVIESTAKPSSLNFIVSDELEEIREPTQTVEILPSDLPPSSVPSRGPTSQPQTVLPDSGRLVTSVASTVPSTGAALSQDPSSSPPTLGIKPSENTNTPGGSPFPSTRQTSPWSRSSLSAPPLKESTSRGPDPEHLKALWSQPPEKTELHPVNSLEAIPDDLTSLPFTLHEVKSEDGSTPPPPAPHPPSRMSLHDVTRAFQQVPQSSAIATAPPRPPISPPSTNAPVARPTNTTYTYTGVPHPSASMRPHPYGSYPSPITSQSPAPMMYPSHPPPMNSSPIPGRMQPVYAQSMWVPVMAPPGNASNMMRPPPYGTPSMMPYSPSPPAASVYPQHLSNMMPPHQQPAQNGVPANRNRSMGPGMSPALSQAPMYPTSPMMMHAHPPAMQHPQSHGYAPMPAGRGQPRTDNTNSPMGHQQHPPSSMPYPSASQAPFARSGW